MYWLWILDVWPCGFPHSAQSSHWMFNLWISSWQSDLVVFDAFGYLDALDWFLDVQTLASLWLPCISFRGMSMVYAHHG